MFSKRSAAWLITHISCRPPPTAERHRDRRVAHDAELSDSDEEDAGRRFDDVAFDDDDEDEEEED